MQKDGNTKALLLHIFAASSIGAAIAAAVAGHYGLCRKSTPTVTIRDMEIIPLLNVTDSIHGDKLESFPHYVARQIGFEDANECPHLCKLASDYLRKSEGCENDIYDFVGKEEESDSLYVKIVEEFDKCILSYLAFHWDHSTSIISQALSVDSNKAKAKLKNFVLAATRKQRFDKVTKDLKVTRVFNTLLVEIKAIGSTSAEETAAENKDVMVPVAHSKRSPVLLFMGGGMGAGKSTVLKDILKESFWSEAAEKAVVVEADAFKETDVIYRALSSTGHHHDMLQTAELVHQSSTDAASSLLVTALNEGRDVIMDGTLSWEPFVEQTIAMARNVHLSKYRMGVGYRVGEDGTITENYWEKTEQEFTNKKPYRIELVGVVCDPYLAVVRGIRRAIIMGRAVRVKSQLRSHKKFANAFPKYCPLVDNARLYCTNSMGTPPKLIGWKDGTNNLLVDEEEIKCLRNVSKLNEEANSIHEMYQQPDPTSQPGSVWQDVVISSSRKLLQHDLKAVIENIEKNILAN